MNFHGATQGFGTGFRQTQSAHFAGGNKFGHGAHGFLDGNVRIDTMLIVEVDGFYAEAFKASVTGAADVRRRAIESASGALGIDAEAELSGHDNTFARNLAEKFTEQLFVLKRPVNFGGVEKIAA